MSKMPEKHMILGVHITDRLEHASEVQNILTEYGCNIKTRLGLHEVYNVCSPNGLLVLELWGEEDRCNEMGKKLNDVVGVETQMMVFAHD
jgi:hypothetical protein